MFPENETKVSDFYIDCLVISTSLVVASGDYSLVAVGGLPIVVASLVDHRL